MSEYRVVKPAHVHEQLRADGETVYMLAATPVDGHVHDETHVIADFHDAYALGYADGKEAAYDQGFADGQPEANDD